VPHAASQPAAETAPTPASTDRRETCARIIARASGERELTSFFMDSLSYLSRRNRSFCSGECGEIYQALRFVITCLMRVYSSNP
jgi:hypothetical protein